jgi:ribosomal protein S18 acetylase RimI-like enzyme
MLSPDVDTTTYYKRYRMEIDLQQPLAEPVLPSGYSWRAWDLELVEVHAEVKFQCFFDEIDAVVFPSLGCRLGCSHLMREISRKSGFRAEATWLISSPDGNYCGTVQGIRERSGTGAIQNLGVTPPHRGKGLGRALLLKALHGFRRTSLHRAFLEVTAQNDSAIRLYRQVGFRCRKTIYKLVQPGAAWVEPALAFGPGLGLETAEGRA